MTENVRVQAYFSGHVQGVGFRFTTMDVASRSPGIGGFVRNLADGRVEVVAEGPEEQVAAFLAAVEEEMGAYIHGAEKKRRPATGEFSGFGIAR